MYPRTASRTPFWLIALAGMVFVFGSFALYSGILSFFNTGGDITAPATATANRAQQATEQRLAELNVFDPNGAIVIPTRLPTKTPIKPCQDFRVNVVKARVRECAKETCPTLETMYNQGQTVCVFGVAAGAADWYEVNIRPDQLYPEIAFMHRSVLDAVRPTPRPSRTPTGFPTVTPVPTVKPPKPTITPTPLPLARPNATPGAVPSP